MKLPAEQYDSLRRAISRLMDSYESISYDTKELNGVAKEAGLDAAAILADVAAHKYDYVGGLLAAYGIERIATVSERTIPNDIRYRTASERAEAFGLFCAAEHGRSCEQCPLYHHRKLISSAACIWEWLDATDEELKKEANKCKNAK